MQLQICKPTEHRFSTVTMTSLEHPTFLATYLHIDMPTVRNPYLSIMFYDTYSGLIKMTNLWSSVDGLHLQMRKLWKSVQTEDIIDQSCEVCLWKIKVVSLQLLRAIILLQASFTKAFNEACQGNGTTPRNVNRN
ncbi:hypothetical protein ILUMI_04547 [Ignelater luminosus]|uniref:Uncharacterized protein n=1 Tax=Ignelater luminosus TaxID=2038154 RepID=A0A8K0D8R9_IGNLU|nr:hypothetical protein ILUMI_04547 [Ignelater luminosus]